MGMRGILAVVVVLVDCCAVVMEWDGTLGSDFGEAYWLPFFSQYMFLYHRYLSITVIQRYLYDPLVWPSLPHLCQVGIVLETGWDNVSLENPSQLFCFIVIGATGISGHLRLQFVAVFVSWLVGSQSVTECAVSSEGRVSTVQVSWLL